MDDFDNLIAEAKRKFGLKDSQVGADRLFRFPALAAAVANGGNPSPPSLLRFSSNVILLAFYGQPASGSTADYAGLEARITFGGDEDLIIDGQAGTWAPLLSLFGQASKPYWKLARPRLAKDGSTISASFRNFTAGPIVPTLLVRGVEIVG